MVRLKKVVRKIRKNRTVSALFIWLPSFLLSVAVVFAFHFAVFASAPPSGSELLNFIQQGGFLQVGSVSEKNYQQVYYTYNGNYFFITDEPNNHRQVVGEGRYLAWERTVKDTVQIVVYDVVTRSDKIVAQSGVNMRPAIDELGNVAWERWNGDGWDIWYYEQESNLIYRITQDGGIRADVDGRSVLYAQRTDDGLWRSVSVTSPEQEPEIIASGTASEAGWPQFKRDGSITTEKAKFSRYISPL